METKTYKKVSNENEAKC